LIEHPELAVPFDRGRLLLTTRGSVVFAKPVVVSDSGDQLISGLQEIVNETPEPLRILQRSRIAPWAEDTGDPPLVIGGETLPLDGDPGMGGRVAGNTSATEAEIESRARADVLDNEPRHWGSR